MARVEHTCTGCVPIDASIIDVYVTLVETNKSVTTAEASRSEAEAARVEAETLRTSTFATDHGRAVADHSIAQSDHATAGSDHTSTVAATNAANAAAAVANAKAELVQARLDTADADHTRAEGDHSTAVSDHSTASSDHTTAQSDHTTAGTDHTRAESDHSTAASDHTASGTATAAATAAATLATEKAALVQDKLDRADTDHTRAESDHTTAVSDHGIAGTDHTTATGDHTTASADHTLAGTDHTTAASDHTTAGSDHTLAASDHTTASADHTQALADHEVMAGYDTRLTNAETEVSQLQQEVIGLVEKDFVWADGYVNANWQVATSTVAKFCQPILFKAGEVLHYRSGTGYVKAVIAVQSSAPISVGDNIPWQTSQTLINASVNIEYAYVFTEDKYVIISVKKDDNTVYVTPNHETIPDKINRLDDTKVSKSAGKNLFDNVLTEGYFDAQGNTVLVANNSRSVNFIPIKPNTAYHISRQNDGEVFYGDFGYGVWYDSGFGIISTFAATSKDVTSPANAAYMRVSIRDEYNVQVQIEEGSARTQYEAYNPIAGYIINLPNGVIDKDKISPSDIDSEPKPSSQNLVLSGGVTSYVKDSIGLSDFNKVTIERKNLFDKSSATIGSYINSAGTIVGGEAYGYSDVIPVLPNTEYHLSVSAPGAPDYQVGNVYTFGIFFLADGTKTLFNTGSKSITTPADCIALKFSFIKAYIDTIQFEKGNTRTEYQPFISSDIEEYLDGLFANNPTLLVDAESLLPRQVFVIKGEQNSIYHSEYCKNYNPNQIYPDKSGGTWKFYQRCWRIQANDEPSGNLNFTLRTKKGDTALKTFNIPTRVGLKTNTTNNIKINVIGDSFCYAGHYIKQISDCCGNAVTVGMRKTANYSTLMCEGRSGWKLADYYNPKSSSVSLSRIESFSPFMHPAGYKYFGVIEFWAAIVNGTSQYPTGTNGFDNYASWFGADGRKLNPTLNDLMYNQTAQKFEYWDGNAWTQLAQDPEFSFDYGKYIDAWQIDSPDFVVIQLGTNDFFSGDADMTLWFNRMDAVIESINYYADAEGKDINILICTVLTASSTPNNTYGNSPVKRNHFYYDARKAVIEKYDTQANYDDNNVTVVDTGVVVDDEYGFYFDEILPFAYYEGTARELYDWNGVHPNEGGYKQFGNPIAGAIQYLRQ